MRSLLLLLLCPAALGWTVVGQGIAGWDTKRLTVYVNTQGCSVEESKLLATLDASINAWNGLPTTGVELQRQLQTSAPDVSGFIAGTLTEVPVILCDPNFSASNNVDGNFVPAATRLSSTGGRLSYGGILLNSEAATNAEISQLSSEELLITVAHELGHVLGLGHSGHPEALMYYSINGKTSAIVTQDDLDGVSYLYPRNEFERNPFGFSCNAVHRSRTSETIGWTWVLLFVGMNLIVGRFVVRRQT